MEARNGLVQTQEQDITLTDAGSDAGSVKQGGDEEVAPAKDSSSDNGSTDDSSASEGSTGTEGKICEGEEKNPWTKPYVGIPVNYFSVGVILGGSVSVLYPILIIQNNVTSSFYAAAASLVTVFWSYKILFGLLCDCFPFRGLKWRPYIVCGWALCALMMALLALMGNGISPINLVIMLTFANFGYVVADVAADGYMVWMAHHEKRERRGKIQTLIYITRSVGRIFMSIVIIFAFSGPAVNCPGYQTNPNVPCNTDEAVASRSEFYEEFPDTWCYKVCDRADFSFGMTIPQFAWLITGIMLASMPTYFMLHEEKKDKKKVGEVLSDFWIVMQQRAVWQVMLYTMISSITFNVFIAAKSNANFVWLDLSTAQNQIINIVEASFFMFGLWLVRQYALGYSWRKMIWVGSMLVTIFNLLYLLIVFDIVRNPWFYMFMDVTDTFMYTLNFTASVFAIVEVSKPGFETITYALITTANNATIPLSVVISYQMMAFFPDLNTQDGLREDTPKVRKEFALLIVIVEIINLTSLFSLPMLPRQKKESAELLAKGETSTFWAKFTIWSAAIFLVYSTIVTFFTVGAADTLGCYKILGGNGCTDNESSIPVYFLIGIVFLYVYGVNFYFTFWPIIRGEKKFEWSMFF